MNGQFAMGSWAKAWAPAGEGGAAGAEDALEQLAGAVISRLRAQGMQDEHRAWRLPQHLLGNAAVADVLQQADRGDDVILICNDERLVQIDFNRHSADLIEFTGQLSDLTAGEEGTVHFGKGKRRIKPLDRNHIAIMRYDYIVILERVSGTPGQESPMAFPAA